MDICHDSEVGGFFKALTVIPKLREDEEPSGFLGLS